MSSQNEAQEPKPIQHQAFDESRTPEQWLDLLDNKFPSILGEHIQQIKAMDIDSLSLNMDKAIKYISGLEINNIILRALNNIYFNDADNKLHDTQRACVLLGFQSVRNITLLYSIMHYIQSQCADNPVIQKEVALAVHSCIIASLMEKVRNKSRNSEPGISALLLFSIAKLIILYLAGETAQIYCKQSEKKSLTPDDEAILFGFTFIDFAQALAQKWHLGDVFTRVIQHQTGSQSYHYIFLARNLALCLSHGWRSKRALESIEAVEKWLNIGVTEMRSFLMQSVEMAFEELDLYGNHDLLDHIKLPQSESQEHDEHDTQLLETKPDKALCKKLLRELKDWHKMHPGRNYDELLKHISDNMLLALNIDRVVIAFLSKDHNSLKGRYINEVEETAFMDRFIFELVNPEGWLFQHVLREKRAAWMGSKSEKILTRYRNAALTAIVGRGQFFMAPIVVGGRSIGLIYADRSLSKHALNIVSYEAFIDVCDEMNAALANLK